VNVLVSSICFINHNKLHVGSEIYATFANRLIESTMENTPFDFRIATNRPDLFEEILQKWPDRVSILIDKLENNQVQVGPFNQLLKFFALKDIPESYDYVLYLDCDASFCKPIDMNLLKMHIEYIENQGYNGMVNRSYTNYLIGCLMEHEVYKEKLELSIKEGKEEFIPKNLFSHKFDFYDVTMENIPEEWKDATLPCEHIIFLKNETGKIQMVSDKISEFNDKLETQVNEPYIRCISDMEAFEIGISAKLAGFKFSEIDTYVHNDVLSVKFNGSNWEGVKL